jgi:aspartyl-tRNA(Asn)/glutamyl-tRNA(Gln) amidotransferase subunit A
MIADLSARQVVAAYRAGDLSPVEVARDALARAQSAQDRFNPFVFLDEGLALESARASEARWRAGAPLGPADGVVATVKANLALAGWPMRRASFTVPDTPMAFDAPAVARLREAGAVIIGQTTMPEFGWIGVCHSRLNGITRNPWNVERTPGGSSGGAAVAAALRIGHLHLGTDGAGSIRIPASFTGVFGIKPTFGRVAAFPASPFGSLAHVGPLAASVEDGALGLSLIAGPDARDMWSMPTPAPDFVEELGRGIRGLRLAWSPRLGQVTRLAADVEALTAGIAHRLTEFGARVEEADPDFTVEEALAPLRVLWEAGCTAILDAIPTHDHALVDPGFVAFAIAGRRWTGADVARANQQRAALHRKMLAFHERFDALLTPMMPTTALPAGRMLPDDASPEDDWLSWSPYSYPFNVTAQPASTIPVGLGVDAMPVGVQIVAASHRDDVVLRVSVAVERLAAAKKPPFAP